MDLEPEGKVFVVITLTGSFTEGKNEFGVVCGICVLLSSYSIGISIIEMIKRIFYKRYLKKRYFKKLTV